MDRRLVQPNFYIDEQRPWLGGFCIGGDEATFYPTLWKWLVEEYGVRSVLDVGCGEGQALRFFQEQGLEDLYGVDGVGQDIPGINFTQHDYTEGELDLSEMHLDLVWSCEFVEHVEERFIPNFILSFVAGDLVLMTHAWPGQQGHHHVNLQTGDYWRGVMATVGYELDWRLTALTRELADEDTPASGINHYARSGLAFERN